MDKIKTGQLIKEARKNKNYTQSELGDMLGVTNKAISRWENGDSFPDIGVLEELANILDLKIQDLVTGEIQGDDKAYDETTIAEIVRLAKTQMREKRRRIFGNLAFIGILILAVVAGIAGMGSSDLFYSDASDIMYYILLAFTLGVIVCEGACHGKEKLRKRSGVNYRSLIAFISFVWAVFMTIGVSILVTNGIIPFGMNLSSVGPFIMYQLTIIFVINVMVMIFELFRWSRGTGLVHVGYIISAGTMYLCALYGDLLHRLAEIDGFYRNIAERTIVVVIEISIAVIIGKILCKSENTKE